MPASQPSFRDVVGDRKWRVDRIAHRIDRLDQRLIADRGLFAADGESGAQGMCVVNNVGCVALHAVTEGFAGDIGRNAVNQKIADGIRHEVQEVITGEIRQLPVEAVRRALQRKHAELGVLVLAFVECRRVEIRDSERAGHWRISVQSDRLAGDVGNLEPVGGSSGDQAHARRRVDERRHVGEAFVLVREKSWIALSEGSGFSMPSVVCR